MLITSEAAVNFVKLADFGYDHMAKGNVSTHGTTTIELSILECTSKEGDCHALGCIGQQLLAKAAGTPTKAKLLFEELQASDPATRPTAQHALFVLHDLNSTSVALKTWTYVADITVTGHHYTSLMAGFGSIQVVSKTRAELHQVALEAIVCENQHIVDAWLELCSRLATLRHPHLLPVISLTHITLPSSTGVAMSTAVYPQGATLLGVVQQYTASELRRMICVDVLLGLEFLAARQIFVPTLSTAQCRVLDGRCQLIVLTKSPSLAASSDVVACFQRFLVACQRELGLGDDTVLQHLITSISESKPANVGSKANPVSLLVIKAQNACLEGVQWQLSFNTLEFVSRLGQGQFGDVSLMRLLQPVRSPNATEAHRTTHFVAVKRLLDPSCEAEFEQELAMMSQMHHPNLVSLLWIVSKPSCLVLEFLDGGSLQDWLSTSTGLKATDGQKQQIACGIIAGMAELARLNIVHRDLAARNVLLSADGSIVKVGWGIMVLFVQPASILCAYGGLSV